MRNIILFALIIFSTVCSGQSKVTIVANNQFTASQTVSGVFNKSRIPLTTLNLVYPLYTNTTGDTMFFSVGVIDSLAGISFAPLNSPTFTGTVVLPSTTSIGAVSSTEIGYVDGVTSSIQTQLNSKASSSLPQFDRIGVGVAPGNFLVTFPNVANDSAGIDFSGGAGTRYLATTSSGVLTLGGMNFSITGASALFMGSGAIRNNVSANNASITFPTTGVLISRNVADASSAITINQVNVSSTGAIIDAQFSGSSKFSVTSTGGVTITQSPGDNSTKIATTAYADAIAALKANIVSPTFTGTVVLPSTTSIGSVTSTEIGYLSGVTGAIQTQLAALAPLSSPQFTNTIGIGVAAGTYYITFPGSPGTTAGIDFGSGVTIANTSSNTLTIAANVAINGSSAILLGSGSIRNNVSANNAAITLPTTGMVVTRNVADANTALTINQSNASSTGLIADFQFGASSKASISSTGFLPPRLTTTQRNAISSPATGLSIYCTDCTALDASTGVMQTYNGSTWKSYW